MHLQAGIWSTSLPLSRLVLPSWIWSGVDARHQGMDVVVLVRTRAPVHEGFPSNEAHKKVHITPTNTQQRALHESLWLLPPDKTAGSCRFIESVYRGCTDNDTCLMLYMNTELWVHQSLHIKRVAGIM